MTKFIIDAYAWIEYFAGSQTGLKVKKEIDNEENEILTSTITIAEIASKISREGKEIEMPFKVINSVSKIIEVDEKQAREAGILHAEIRKKIKDFGLADAFLLALARDLNAKVITGDRHFKDFKETFLIQK